jgi:hypothetical protein
MTTVFLNYCATAGKNRAYIYHTTRQQVQSQMQNKCWAVAILMLSKCSYAPSGTFPMSKPYYKEEERS